MCTCDRDEEKHTPVTKNKRKGPKHRLKETSALTVHRVYRESEIRHTAKIN